MIPLATAVATSARFALLYKYLFLNNFFIPSGILLHSKIRIPTDAATRS
jgi:hypothetical protein